MFVLPKKKSSFWQNYQPVEELIEHDNFIERKVILKLPFIKQSSSILFISDLHWSEHSSPATYTYLAKLINQQPADWLIFAGDLFSYLEFSSNAFAWLSSLEAKSGKIAVLGNRESKINWKNHNFWRKAYEKIAYKCLINEAFQASEDLIFFGTDDYRFGKVNWTDCRKFLYKDKLVVTISHNPDAIVDEGQNFVGHLCLSGHTHGGQVKLPLLGAPYSSSVYGSQFVSGWRKRQDDSILHISTGIGESGFKFFKKRINCPAEFTRIKISKSICG
jgi:predicted MPP superfamily phosphohydrolase